MTTERMVECSYCRLQYVAGNREDEQEHRTRHRRWETALTALGYTPADRQTQETAKDAGRALLAVATTDAERLRGAELLVRARFDRSLESAITQGYWRQHPPYARYAAMIDGWGDLPTEALALLRAKYGREAGGIASGYSYWQPRHTD